MSLTPEAAAQLVSVGRGVAEVVVVAPNHPVHLPAEVDVGQGDVAGERRSGNAIAKRGGGGGEGF